MASFAIEPAFWELFPQAEIGIVVARGIDNAHESSEDVKAALAEANKALSDAKTVIAGKDAAIGNLQKDLDSVTARLQVYEQKRGRRQGKRH